MADNQYCELCHQWVDDVEPAKVRGGELVMVCTRCRSYFDSRVKVRWGRHQDFQYYWDLGASPVTPTTRGIPRKFVEVNLTKEAISVLRAAGFVVVSVENKEVLDG